jgi:hypothetical protein
LTLSKAFRNAENKSTSGEINVEIITSLDLHTVSIMNSSFEYSVGILSGNAAKIFVNSTDSYLTVSCLLSFFNIEFQLSSVTCFI